MVGDRCRCRVGGAGRLTFDGDLRRLSVQTEALSHGEAVMTQVWGDVRSRTLIFSQGADEQEALAVNARVAEVAATEESRASLVSLATLLPAEPQQQQSGRRWQNFWQRQQQQWARFCELAQQQGFSATAFQPFERFVQQQPERLNLEFWQQAGLGTLIEGLQVNDLPQGTAVVSLLDTAEAAADSALALDDRLEQIPGVVVVDQSRFRQQLSAQVGHDFITFIVRAMVVVVVVLAVWYRRLSRVMLALLPGAVWSAGDVWCHGVAGAVV